MFAAVTSEVQIIPLYYFVWFQKIRPWTDSVSFSSLVYIEDLIRLIISYCLLLLMTCKYMDSALQLALRLYLIKWLSLLMMCHHR